MKKLFLIITACVLISSCGVKESPNEQAKREDLDNQKATIINEKGDTTFIDYKALPNLLNSYYLMLAYARQHGQHNITLNHTVQLLKAYQNKFPNSAYKNSFGGFINRDHITNIPEETQGKKRGLVYFLCFKENGSGDEDDEVFIAFKGVNNYNYSDDYFEQFNDEDDFFISRLNFKYSTSAIADEAKIQKFLQEDFPYAAGDNAPKKYRDFKDYVTAFSNKFICDKVDESGTEKCNLLPCGLFEKADLNLLVNQVGGINGVRFFYGLDESENENKIRLVLIAANEKKNIVTYKITLQDGSEKLVNAEFLERSHP